MEVFSETDVPQPIVERGSGSDGTREASEESIWFRDGGWKRKGKAKETMEW